MKTGVVRGRRARVVAAFFALSFFDVAELLAAPPAAATIVEFGVGPQQSTTELARRWVPVMRYLSEKSGLNVVFRTAKDIPTYQAQARAGRYDVIFINPYHYTLLHKNPGYEVFAQQKDAVLEGVLVVRKGGPIKELAQLDGSVGAFPAPTAVTATVLPLRHLKKQGIEVKPEYVTSHDSVYRAVAKGLYLVGGGESRTFEILPPEVKNDLAVIWKTEALPPFVFAAHPRVAPEVVTKLKAAMLQMERDPAAAPLLKGINFKGIAPAVDADYDVVRRLNIQMPKP